jgi:hypothetical protein
MKNVTDLRNDLLDVYQKTKSGDIDLKTASELANVAGKVIKVTAVELSYLQFTKSDRKIKFLES